MQQDCQVIQHLCGVYTGQGRHPLLRDARRQKVVQSVLIVAAASLFAAAAECVQGWQRDWGCELSYLHQGLQQHLKGLV